MEKYGSKNMGPFFQNLKTMGQCNMGPFSKIGKYGSKQYGSISKLYIIYIPIGRRNLSCFFKGVNIWIVII